MGGGYHFLINNKVNQNSMLVLVLPFCEMKVTGPKLVKDGIPLQPQNTSSCLQTQGSLPA